MQVAISDNKIRGCIPNIECTPTALRINFPAFNNVRVSLRACTTDYTILPDDEICIAIYGYWWMWCVLI
jgi:hypothetical protein